MPAPGETIKKEIRGGEAHSLGVALAAGEYAQFVFRWQGVDVEVAVFKPDGSRMSKFVVPVGAAGAASVSVVADVAGNYRLEVRPREKLKINGSYEVRLEAVRVPTPADEARFAAENLLAEGRQQKSKAAQEEKLNQAMSLWRSAEDAAGEAATLHALADMHKLSGDLPNALKYYDAAIALRRKMGDRAGEAHTLLDEGRACRDLSSPEEALKYNEKALLLFREAGDRTGEAMSLHNTGLALALMGRMREAVRFYEEALSMQRADGDRLREVSTLNALGGAYDRLGDYDRALSFYQQAAPIRLELGDRLRAALTDANIGVLHDNWGEWQKAKESYETARAAYESLLAPEGLKACVSDKSEPTVSVCRYAAAALENLGELYNSLGDPQTALEKFEASLAIAEALRQPRWQGSTRSRMCYSKLLQEKPREALKFCEEALSFQRPPDEQKPSIDPPGLASTYIVMGMASDMLDERERALDYYTRALKLHEQSGELRSQALTLDKTGEAYARAGDPQSALESFKKALSLWQRVKEQEGEAITLYKTARVERDLGHLPEAHRQVTKSLDIIESLRVKVGSQRLRASYFSSKLNYYELDVDLKMQLAKAGGLGVASPGELVAEALQVNERARARGLLDILNEAQVEPRDNSDPVLAGLLRQRQALQRKLNHMAAMQTRLLGSGTPREDSATIEKEIAQLAAEFDESEARIRARSPRYAELSRPQTVSLAQIQQQLLDEQTLLLEYALGDERSYLWVVSPTGVKFYELPRRAEIEDVARRVGGLLRAEQKQPGELERAYQPRLAAVDTQLREQSALLSRMLLAPAASELGAKRLLVVADGELQQLPFAALPVPETTASARATGEGGGAQVRLVRASAASSPSTGALQQPPQPLAAEHEIVNLPSASTLAALRVETRRRTPATKAVAVIADPVFDRDDSRLQLALRGKSSAASSSSPTHPHSLEDAVRSFGAELPRLPASRQEAKEIVAAAPAGASLTALDFAASRTTATDSKLSQYRFVHFATHGIFNDKQPELSGVVLSLFDERGQPREDGFLRLHDIYGMRLPVEMVVLSACQTGLGKQVRGEGLIGLTRGFMYAGAERVVASLWKVDDAATAELMSVFYKGMLRDGLPPPAALRAAQMSVRAQKRWHAPYYWAGFVLQGEWK